jgi:hypothetical protein
MANPTTNFGWVMPTATDLVTDLPADFAVFGQAVDTSMADLKGGTTGQILAKATSTDMDFTWVTNDVGDITAVTAGTGISGGGTSGAVTITNSMATEITAKGDLIAGTGSATFDNLPVGTNGQTLVADSTASTGLKWAAPSAAAFVGASVYASASLTIPNNTYTLVTFNTEHFDTDAFHSTSTNTGRMTIPSGKDGKYAFTFSANSTSLTGKLVTRLYKNGSGGKLTVVSVGGTDANYLFQAIESAVAGDYFEIYVSQNAGISRDIEGGSTYNWFQVQYLGA